MKGKLARDKGKKCGLQIDTIYFSCKKKKELCLNIKICMMILSVFLPGTGLVTVLTQKISFTYFVLGRWRQEVEEDGRQKRDRWRRARRGISFCFSFLSVLNQLTVYPSEMRNSELPSAFCCLYKW